MAENFMRSAMAPVMMAVEITAKVIWNTMKTVSGMLPALGATVTISLPMSRLIPLRKKRSRPPIKALPGVKASE